MSSADIRRRAFAEHIAAGKSGVEAARLAGYKGTEASLANQASRLMRNDDVRQAIAKVAEKASTKRVLTAQERRERLTELADADAEPRDAIAAIKELNAMDGLHLKKIEHSGPDGSPIGAVLAAIPEDVIRARLEALKKGKK